MKTPQEHLDFEDWVDYQFPFSIGPTTFDKVFHEDGKFDRYSVDTVNKMWKAWSAAKDEDTKQLVTQFKEGAYDK